MARRSSSLFLVFMLLVGPVLCIGGLLTHQCDCGPGENERPCHHENSCSDDPCSAQAIPQGRDARALLDIEVSWMPADFVVRDAAPLSARWSRSASPPMPPDRWNLPYAQSDRPLLI